MLFHDVEGTGYAEINVKGHRETWPVRSSGFRRWLLWSYYNEYRGAPNAEAMTGALGMIEAKAVFEGTEQPVFVRVGHANDGKLYLDLCDDKWRAIEIDTAGWRVIDSPPIRFIRSRGMLPLPIPQKNGSIEKLGSLVNVKSAQDFTLIIAWLLPALRDRGPFPVLVVTGQHGSAKSTLLEILRRLIDPNVANLRAPPKDADDLYITAISSHIVPYENLSAIPDWLSDALTRISTGTAFAKRKLYTDVDEVLLCAEKPIALNGITEIVGAADLGDRSLFIVAQPIDPKERRLESEIWNRFDREHPAILGALLDAVVHGLRTLPTVTEVEWPRMADFAMWATACEGAYAKLGTFKTAYAGNRADAIDPARPPCDTPRERWLQFIDDCGRFIDDGWASCTEALGWTPLDLFGCDRAKPFARIDRAGLLWLLDGRKLLALATPRLLLRAAVVLSHTEDARMNLDVCWRGRQRHEAHLGGMLAPPNVCRTRRNLLRRTEHCCLSKARRKRISSTPRE
jgi:hypothetical protein